MTKAASQKTAAPASQGAALVKFNFEGDELDVVPGSGEVHTVVRRVCEALGISYQGQIDKLKGDPSICLKMILMQIPGDDQRREVACIDLRSLPLWLATIHPNKVKPEVRDKLITYKRRAGEVLADYFLGPRMPAELVPAGNGRPLTARQQEVLGFVKRYAKEFRMPPTIREIRARFDLSSTNAVNDHLEALARKGALGLRRDGRSRGIILPPEPAPPPPAPAPDVRPNAEIAELRGMVAQLVGVVSALANRPSRRRPVPTAQSTIPFPVSP